jgi:hypothetical protein
MILKPFQVTYLSLLINPDLFTFITISEMIYEDNSIEIKFIHHRFKGMQVLKISNLYSNYKEEFF